MGKHDMKIVESSEEFVKNENKNLRKKIAEKDAEIAFANETIRNLQKMCSRMSMTVSEIEAERDEKIAEIAELNAKIAKLVKLYV